MLIWKHELIIKDRQIISIPRGAELLDVQVQGNIPYLWFLCDPEASQVGRIIALYGTGHPLPTDAPTWVYIATFQTPPFVWHAFDLGQYHS